MAIAFSCSCGKAMKAKEAFAGRKVRCPQCDKVVRIPQRDQGEESSVGTPPPARPVSPLPFAEMRDENKERPALASPSKPTPRLVSTKEKDAGSGEQSLRPRVAEPVPRPSFAKEKDSERVPVAAAVRTVPPSKSAETAESRIGRPAAHAWIDQSLSPQPTPWLPGDRERFQKGIKTMREGMSGLEKSMLGLVVLAGVCTAGWLLLNK
jgi:hypothetical protein